MNQMPFVLKTVVAFLFADGLTKLLLFIYSPPWGVFPVPGGSAASYYLLLVAVIEISLSVQFLVRAAYSWLWASLFFAAQIFIVLSLLCFERPVEWLYLGSGGRLQAVGAIILYSFLFFYFLSSPVRRFFEHLQ
jgi:hypothetical protein